MSSAMRVAWKIGKDNKIIADRPGKISVPTRETAHLVCREHGNEVVAERDTHPGERKGVILLTIAPCERCEYKRRLAKWETEERPEIIQKVVEAYPDARYNERLGAFFFSIDSDFEFFVCLNPFDDFSKIMSKIEQARAKALKDYEVVLEKRQLSMRLYQEAMSVELPPRPPIAAPVPQEFTPEVVLYKTGRVYFRLDASQKRAIPGIMETRMYQVWDEREWESEEIFVEKHTPEHDLYIEQAQRALEEHVSKRKAYLLYEQQYQEYKAAMRDWYDSLTPAQRLRYHIEKNEIIFVNGIPAFENWDSYIYLCEFHDHEYNPWS